MCMYIYIYIYVYTHTYIQRERERERAAWRGAPGRHAMRRQLRAPLAWLDKNTKHTSTT